MPYYISYRLPKLSYLDVPMKIEGSMNQMRKKFEALAMSRIRYFESQEFSDYLGEILCGHKFKNIYATNAAISVVNVKIKKKGYLQGRFLENQEILINIDAFIIDGEDYSDIMPFVIRHEIEEGWLKTKKGCLEIKTCKREIRTRTARHKISERKSFLMAEKEGMSQRFFEWLCKIRPRDKDEFKKSWDSIKKRI